MQNQQSKRFLVIGESGVGKSTTVNRLTKANFAVSDTAVGVTFSFQTAVRNGHELVDTVGLSEGVHGTVHPGIAFARLVHFVKEAKSGFNGIFLITDRPRITAAMEKNYELFVRNVTQERVPCYLFVNKQEMHDYSHQYADNARDYANAHFKFASGFAGGWAGGPPFKRCHDWTMQQFDRCIAEAPAERQRLYTEQTGFRAFVQRIWDFFRSLFFPDSDYVADDSSLAGVLHKLGVPRSLASRMAEKFGDESFTEDDIAEWEELLARQSQARAAKQNDSAAASSTAEAAKSSG